MSAIAAERTEGFALVAVLVVLAGGGLLLASALGRGQGDAVNKLRMAEQSVAAVASATEEVWRRTGDFPNDLHQALAQSGIGAAHRQSWRDPFRMRPLDYSVVGGVATIRSSGPDTKFDTADDISAVVNSEQPARANSRNRLRLLRAMYNMSPFMNSPFMSVEEAAQLRHRIRDYSVKMRALTYLSSSQADAVHADLAQLRTEIMTLRAGHAASLTPLVEGLPFDSLIAATIGVPDEVAFDAFGQRLMLTIAGPSSCGADGVMGTADDF